MLCTIRKALENILYHDYEQAAYCYDWFGSTLNLLHHYPIITAKNALSTRYYCYIISHLQ